MSEVRNDYHKLCIDVQKIAQRGAMYIQSQTFDASWLEVKSKNSFVSRVDKTTEGILVEALQRVLPEAGFLTEEETIVKPNKNLRWIIDPLDGTTNYMHGIPCYCVSIALEVDGVIVLGVVYEVNRNECFYAIKGAGAYLGQEKISVSKTNFIADSLLATGFPYYDFNQTSAYLKVLDHLMQESRGIRRMGSACADLAYVACGRFDAFFEYSLHPWDVAAGSLLVKEAGGQCLDFKAEEDYIYGKSIVCGSPLVLAELQKLIQKYF